MSGKMAAGQYNNQLSTSVRSGGFHGLGDAHTLALGASAPDFTLKGLNGKEITLSKFRGKSYVVLEFGSIT
jgi:hypothetical protein